MTRLLAIGRLHIRKEIIAVVSIVITLENAAPFTDGCI